MAQPISVNIANLIQDQLNISKKSVEMHVSLKQYDKAHDAQNSVRTLEHILSTIDTFLDVQPSKKD
jgi:hypothetical protein